MTAEEATKAGEKMMGPLKVGPAIGTGLKGDGTERLGRVPKGMQARKQVM